MKRAFLVLFALLFPLSGLLSFSVHAEDNCAAGIHQYVQISHTPATETTDGIDLFRCTLCGQEYENVSPATRHRWGEWNIEKQPDCTNPGQRYRVCTATRIPHREIQPIDAPGHDYKLAETPPDCETDGVKTYICSRCGDTYTEPGAAALGHGYIAQITKEPSCTEDGVKTFICSHDASKSYTEPIPATGHELGAWTVETSVNEGTPGVEFQACKHCGYREGREILSLPPMTEEPTQTKKTPMFNGLDAALFSFDILVIILGFITLYPGFMAVHRVKKLWKQYLAAKKTGKKSDR